jgi:hypothetical protein
VLYRQKKFLIQCFDFGGTLRRIPTVIRKNDRGTIGGGDDANSPWSVEVEGRLGRR